MPAKMLSRAKKLKLSVQPVHIPEAGGEIDRIIDALATAWNKQACDRQAFEYFQGMTWDTDELLVDSLYRYPEGTSSLPGEREFMVRQLRRFADAIYAATARWTLE